jgi:peptidoglycan/LPS O-acetylase OafA/YrhL
MGKARTAFAVVAGVALLAWWTAEGLGLFGTELASRHPGSSHVMAEILLGGALLLGAWLSRRDTVKGRLVLAGAFGGLAYASLNVMGDYEAQPGMLLVLGLVSALSLVAVASMLKDAR